MSQIPLPPVSMLSGLALSGDGRVAPDRSGPGQIETIAHEFESMLLYQMLRQMRQSMSLDDSEKSGAFGAETMGQTVDLEFARQLSLQGGIGVADLLIRQMKAASGATATPQAAAQLLLRGPAMMLAPAASPAPTVEPLRTPSSQPEGDWLTELPLGGQLTSRFGLRSDPIDGRDRFHRGVDIRAAYGMDVPSPLAGRVTVAGPQGSYGLTVVVEHASGTSTRYAHLSEILVKPGDEVQEGALLGRVGSTGRSTAPHLHFEVLVDGQAVDPEGAVAAVQVSSPDADYFRRPSLEKTAGRSGHED